MVRLRRLFAWLWGAAFLLALTLASPAASTQAGQYVAVDERGDVRLHYEESGSGAPIVCVPGWTMTTRYFDRQLDYFKGSKSTRFITFDPRAHGRSSMTLEGANYRQHARDLKVFIDKLGLDEVVLCGWSWGMDTVYAYLSIYGADKVRAVVNIDQAPNPLASGEGAWTDGDTAAAKMFFDAFVENRAATTQGFLPTMFTKPVSQDDLRWMEADAMLTPDIVAALLFYDGWMFDSTKTVEKLDVPQLYFVAESKAEAAKRFLAAHRPDAELMALGGHAMFYDHATAFNRRLAEFLAKLD